MIVHPAMTLPCGCIARGLPVGLQIVAASGNDDRVFAGAKRIEDLL